MSSNKENRKFRCLARKFWSGVKKFSKLPRSCFISKEEEETNLAPSISSGSGMATAHSVRSSSSLEALRPSPKNWRSNCERGSLESLRIARGLPAQHTNRETAQVSASDRKKGGVRATANISTSPVLMAAATTTQQEAARECPSIENPPVKIGDVGPPLNSNGLISPAGGQIIINKLSELKFEGAPDLATGGTRSEMGDLKCVQAKEQPEVPQRVLESCHHQPTSRSADERRAIKTGLVTDLMEDIENWVLGYICVIIFIGIVIVIF